MLSNALEEQIKICPNTYPYTKASMHYAFSWGYQANFGGGIIATKRTAEALAAQTDIPRERAMLKFKGEDAEAVVAKALEGGIGKEDALVQ